MPKGKIIRALMGMKHSPAGKRYLAKKKKKKLTYSSLRTRKIESALAKQGLTKEQIRNLRGSKNE